MSANSTFPARILVVGLSLAAIILSISLCVCVLIPPRSTVLAESASLDEETRQSYADVHIGVFGLFHPRELVVSAAPGAALALRSGEERVVLEKSSGLDSASVRVSAEGIVVSAGSHLFHARTLTVTSRANGPVDFLLAVPQKLTRRYHGTLEVKPSDGSLLAIVTMDREEAVASVVAAESAPDAPLEALKAQAVAARSYFVAGPGRHHDFDFCDSTHCQFLREPPAPGSAVAEAVAVTRGLVLAYDSHPFAAMYTRSCSGRTRTPAELGIPSAAYPYFPVECKHCREHPALWSSRISAHDSAMLHDSNEFSRLELDRRLGWDAVQSNDFIVKRTGHETILQGTGQGHGIGLCQAGAKAMAEDGADFRQILNHYYPNTTIVSWPKPTFQRKLGQAASLR